MRSLVIFLLVHLVFMKAYGDSDDGVPINTWELTLNQTFIDNVNKMAASWTATVTDAVKQDLKGQKLRVGSFEMGYFSSWRYQFPILKHKSKISKEISLEFDARKAWPQCTDIINHAVPTPLDNCPISWVWVPVSVISDRYCIQTGGKWRVMFSYVDVISCCKNCLANPTNPCSDGISSEVWNFWLKPGIVISDCKPDFDKNATSCKTNCQKTNRNFMRKQFFGGLKYKLRRSEGEIQIDIKMFGPVTAQMKVYQDFLVYDKGVYVYIAGKFLGYQVVKIIGWGVENKVPYWLCGNPLGLSPDRFFKILRGQDHCKIESEVLAGNIDSKLDPHQVFITEAKVSKINNNLLLMWIGISVFLFLV